MTTTLERPTQTNTASINSGALDALVNSTLTRIRRGDGYALLPTQIDDDANEALYNLLGQLSAEHRDAVLKHNGFRLGMLFAQLHLADPLGDHGQAVRMLIDEAIQAEIDGE